MPDGAGVVLYRRKRGDVWRIRYVDAGGTHVQERLGRADQAWSRKRAEEELRHRLADVKREGLRRPDVSPLGALARGRSASALGMLTIGGGRPSRSRSALPLMTATVESATVSAMESKGPCG